MKRTERIQLEKDKRKKKAILGSAIISVAILFNATISFADADVNGLMESWYNKKAEIAKSAVDKALQSEIETQKLRIKEELKKKLDASASELSSYTDQEIKTRKEAILKHADDIIKNTDFSVEADKNQIKGKLDEILNNAIKAMDEVKTNSNKQQNPNPNQQGTKGVENETVQKNPVKKP